MTTGIPKHHLRRARRHKCSVTTGSLIVGPMLCIGYLFLNQASLYRDADVFNVISQISPVFDAEIIQIGGLSDGKVEGGDETAITILQPPESLVDGNGADEHLEKICEEKDGKPADFCVNVVTSNVVLSNRKWLNSLCPIDETTDDEQQTAKREILVGPLLEWKSVLQTLLSEEQVKPKRMSGQTSIMSEHEMHPTQAIGSFSETVALMLAKIRCGDHFSLVRFGDGELAILNNKRYHVLDNWNFSGKKTEGTDQIQDYMKDAFQLAAEGGIYLGLPIFFCAEGTTSPLGIQVGGGGNPTFYNPYRDILLSQYDGFPLKQIVHSWQWGNLNYPRFIEMLNQIASAGKRCIAIFGEDLQEGMLQIRPKWLWGALTVPANGYVWLEADPSGIVASATELAKSIDDAVFLFSAGPITNVLVPAMTRANDKNSYIDVGGALTMELAGKSTREFHDSYVRAGGALQNDQTCTESRWNVDGTPEVPVPGLW